jgi:hypothetical protein
MTPMKARLQQVIHDTRFVGEPIWIARKVLEAMRDPTPDMIEAATERGTTFESIWQEMIDAALGISK